MPHFFDSAPLASTFDAVPALLTRMVLVGGDVLAALGMGNAQSAITEDRLGANFVGTWRQADARNAPLVLEGVSEYKLNARASITEHRITITYPATPFTLLPLRKLLPVRSNHGLIGAAHMPAALPFPRLQNAFAHLFASVREWFGPEGKVVAVIVETLREWAGVGSWSAMGFDEVPKPVQQSRFDIVGGHQQPALQSVATRGFGGFGKGFFAQVKGAKLPKKCEHDYDCNREFLICGLVSECLFVRV